MRKPLVAGLSLALALPLIGCAAAPEKKPSFYDTEFMSEVETRARDARVQVIWINPPRRPSQQPDDNDG